MAVTPSPLQAPSGPPDPAMLAYLAQSRSPEILFGSIFPAAFATIFVFARFYSRAVIIQNWGHDDSWILLSWILGCVVLTVINCLLTRHGAGRHIAAIAAEDITNIAILIKYGFVARIVYSVTLLTTKFGICAFYLRIFEDGKSRTFVWSMVAFNALYTVPIIFALAFQCSPIAAAWSIIPNAKCRDDVPLLYASSILNIVSNAALLIFVIPKIYRLKIARRQKISLIAVLCLSILVIVAAIVRLVRILQIADSKDIPYDSYDICIWTAVEVGTGLFCASAPATKPLLRQIAPGLLSSNPGSTNKITLDTYSRRHGGLGTKTNRGMGSDALELSSQADLGFESSERKERVWAGGKGRKNRFGGDDESEVAVLSNAAAPTRTT